MTSNRILQLNALATAGSALGMLLTRNMLFQWFGAPGPLLFDVIAIGLLGYAAALWMSARKSFVTRSALLAFTAADTLWVVGSAIVLLLFWSQLAPIARVLVIAAAVIVDVFAMLQFRAAGRVSRRTGAPLEVG
jgi:hypothetical protein